MQPGDFNTQMGRVGSPFSVLGIVALAVCVWLGTSPFCHAAELPIRDIAPPVELPPAYSVWILAGSIALLGLAGGAAHWFRRRGVAGAEPRRSSAGQLALQALDQLLAEEILSRLGTKEFYRRVTDILRQHLADQFGLRAPERTTREFLAGLQADMTLNERHKQLLQQLLVHCDLVKFAEHQPTSDDIRNVFECCREFIKETSHEV